jgi:hypothetical protein
VETLRDGQLETAPALGGHEQRPLDAELCDRRREFLEAPADDH